MTPGDDDATVNLRAAAVPPRRSRRLVPAAVLVVLAAVGGIGWLVQHPSRPPIAPVASLPSEPASAPEPPSAAKPTTAPERSAEPLAATAAAAAAPGHMPAGQTAAPPAAARVPVVVANEAAILAEHASALQVFRFAPAPRVLVLSFPTLREQGRMLNRMGAFVEKAGLPRHRVLAEPELVAAMTKSKDSEETFYYGHDYRAADLARFFDDAARDASALRPEELLLRALLEQEGLLAPGAAGALISIPPESVTPLIDASSRATILHHELAHGMYFTDPAYAAWSRAFWSDDLTEAQRAGFRRYLGGLDYDTGNDDLMINEAQAYLIHTSDPRYFRPELAGLSATEASSLRRAFWRGMPAGWLKDATTARLGGG